MNLENYCTFLEKVRGLKHSTIANNRHSVLGFLGYLDEIGKSIQNMGVGDVYDHTMQLKEKDRPWSSRYHHTGAGKIATGTVRCKMLDIKKYLEWAYSNGYTTFDPKYIKVPMNHVNKIECLTDYEVVQLIEAPREMHTRDDMYYRDTLLFMVGYYMGLRVSEALALTFDELKCDFVLVQAKNKKRKIPVPFKIREFATQYEKIRGGIVEYKETYTRDGEKKERKRTCQDLNPSVVFTSLSLTTYGMPIDCDGLGVIFRKYEKFIGIKKRITYHMFRKTFATHLLQSGVDLFTVQQMMGHKNVTSTQYYITSSDDQKIEAQGKLGSMWVKRIDFVQKIPA